MSEEVENFIGKILGLAFVSGFYSGIAILGFVREAWIITTFILIVALLSLFVSGYYINDVLKLVNKREKELEQRAENARNGNVKSTKEVREDLFGEEK